ncbi:hypothetical protein [Haloarcula sp. CBA1129]|uniref:hypothetical protein n=1 Tax=Haloarcula sp. CBA1129 TaxID=1853684 RepID=UPI001246D426|nr:hypothetical protein [Haloarcula sp. CBA1129]KAA9399678.1 hypothetical protein Har1129_16215 [Haloarcula sp. CBA1129]
MLPDPIIYQMAAILGASGLAALGIEARWTHKAVLRHDRQLSGTDHRKGIATLVNKYLRGKETDEN